MILKFPQSSISFHKSTEEFSRDCQKNKDNAKSVNYRTPGEGSEDAIIRKKYEYFTSLGEGVGAIYKYQYKFHRNRCVELMFSFIYFYFPSILITILSAERLLLFYS